MLTPLILFLCMLLYIYIYVWNVPEAQAVENLCPVFAIYENVIGATECAQLPSGKVLESPVQAVTKHMKEAGYNFVPCLSQCKWCGLFVSCVYIYIYIYMAI